MTYRDDTHLEVHQVAKPQLFLQICFAKNRFFISIKKYTCMYLKVIFKRTINAILCTKFEVIFDG